LIDKGDAILLMERNISIWKFEGVFQDHFVFDMKDVSENWTYEELEEYRMACSIKNILKRAQ
jgi:hypothetical protein